MSGVETRSAARKRPASAAGSSATPLKSPLLSDLWQPAKRQARTASRAAPSLRSIRKRGGSGEPVALSGLLGTLPAEVSGRVGEGGGPNRRNLRPARPCDRLPWPRSTPGRRGSPTERAHPQPPAPGRRATAAAGAARRPTDQPRSRGPPPPPHLLH